MSQFYLTLPSNSSEKYYPDNTLTHFITKLHNDVSLDGEWEVGLADIMYPRNWYNVDHQHLTLICTNCSKIVPEFTLDEGIPKDYEIRVGIPSGYYNTAQELVEVLNNSITKAYRKPVRSWSTNGINRYVDESQWPKIAYNKHNRCIYITMQQDTAIRFSKKLAHLLGFDVQMVESTSIIGDRPVDIEGGLHALYVYCDVLECVAVGDTMAPLLRIVTVKGSRGEMSYVQYDQPRYVPLQKKSFDSIEIDIRDDIGKPIPFDAGKLIVTLHFRRSRDSYFLG
jgi:hypothetical protein